MSLKTHSAEIDRELLDWMGAEVIVCRPAPRAKTAGWLIQYWGVCGLPATDGPLFFPADSLREALAQAREQQQRLRAEYAARRGERLAAIK